MQMVSVSVVMSDVPTSHLKALVLYDMFASMIILLTEYSILRISSMPVFVKMITITPSKMLNKATHFDFFFYICSLLQFFAMIRYI